MSLFESARAIFFLVKDIFCLKRTTGKDGKPKIVMIDTPGPAPYSDALRDSKFRLPAKLLTADS